jgi:hypothetical protein
MKREVPFHLRVTPSEKEAFIQASGASGLSLSAWARSVLLAGCKVETRRKEKPQIVSDMAPSSPIQEPVVSVPRRKPCRMCRIHGKTEPTPGCKACAEENEE